MLDDFDVFVEKHGQPDVDDTTANDEPRPPMVTRWIVYAKERVRATYIPDAKVGEGPPYQRWKLAGFQDTETDAVLHPAEVAERMKERTEAPTTE